MEFGPTHIIVPLVVWNAIKQNVEVLEQKSFEVIVISQKVCEVNEISGSVKSLMQNVETDKEAYCTGDCELGAFQERGKVNEFVPQALPTFPAAYIPEVSKQHPVPPACPPPRDLLVNAHGPYAIHAIPKAFRPWRSNGTPYRNHSSSRTSSSAASSWNTHEVNWT